MTSAGEMGAAGWGSIGSGSDLGLKRGRCHQCLKKKTAQVH